MRYLGCGEGKLRFGGVRVTLNVFDLIGNIFEHKSLDLENYIYACNTNRMGTIMVIRIWFLINQVNKSTQNVTSPKHCCALSVKVLFFCFFSLR